jgi:hypothetical protein
MSIFIRLSSILIAFSLPIIVSSCDFKLILRVIEVIHYSTEA